MIPILYEYNETQFESNGLGRLRSCISCEVTEERNGVYECIFEYPVDGSHYSDIILGRIIAVEHDDSGDVQPFEIYKYSKPINGVVTFYAQHISYRLSGIVATLSGMNGLQNILTALKVQSVPANNFTYETSKTGSGYVAIADGTPRSVREYLGGSEGSILDTFGGEYEFDKFRVMLWENRGQDREITIRYGVNMTEFTDEVDSSESFNACIPYWKNGSTIVKGSMVEAELPSWDGVVRCAPLDLSDKFESQPTVSQVVFEAGVYMRTQMPYLPTQNVKLDFIRLRDSEEYKNFEDVQKCHLCDTVRVIFPMYGTDGRMKIVKVVWDVLQERYTEMELGNLSISLAQALGLK